MLSKLNRLSTKEIDLLFKKGASFRTPLVTIRRRATDSSLARFAVMFAKGNKLNSVERNRLKRQVYSQIEKELPNYQTGADYGILLSTRLIGMKDEKRREELAPVLKHLMKPNQTNA
ncbi:MAG: ribonuclease P protein component [Candidatus Peregrinibacteria bacterium]|nr:ribonuclease P protein component [Candidatus Peregrinibacteria bacterium]